MVWTLNQGKLKHKWWVLAIHYERRMVTCDQWTIIYKWLVGEYKKWEHDSQIDIGARVLTTMLVVNKLHNVWMAPIPMELWKHKNQMLYFVMIYLATILECHHRKITSYIVM